MGEREEIKNKSIWNLFLYSEKSCFGRNP